MHSLAQKNAAWDFDSHRDNRQSRRRSFNMVQAIWGKARKTDLAKKRNEQFLVHAGKTCRNKPLQSRPLV